MHRVFSNTVGLTIHEYILRRKLTEAAKLLVFSNNQIIDIAIIAGYETQQAFSTSFKIMYKLSPNQFREQALFYPLQLRFTLKKNPILNNCKINLEDKIALAQNEDIGLLIDLVRLTVDGFPYLNETEYIIQLKNCIKEKRTLIMKDEDIVVGILIFNYNLGSIDFMAIHPQYRKSGIAKAFLNELMTKYIVCQDISITTFRNDDKADTGYREEYSKLGFTESELLIEFGYPTQKFKLHVQIQEDKLGGKLI